MKPAENLEQLDAMIAQEKHNVAEEFVYEAWQEAASEGIEVDIIAKATVQMVMRQLVIAYGEEAAQKFVDDMPELMDAGVLRGISLLN